MRSDVMDCVCIFCKANLEDIESLIDHMALNHSQKSRERFSLNQSKEMSQTVHEYEPHRDEICEKITGISGFRCKYCDFHARSVVKVRRHCYFKHLFYRPYCCSYCGFLSMESSKILQHCSIRHPEEISTEIQIKFGDPRGSKYGNVTTKRLNFDEDVIKTVKAPSQPSTKMTFQMEMLSYQCGHCGTMFKTEEDFLTHVVNWHSNINVYRCKLCRFSTNNFNLMEKHQSELHKPLECVSRRKMPYSGDSKDIPAYVEFKNTTCGVVVGSLLELYQRMNAGDSILMDVQLQVMRSNGKTLNDLPDSEKGDFASYPFEHLQDTRLGSKQIRCFYCSFKSQSLNLLHLLYHVIEFHTTLKPFTCCYCSYSSNSRDKVILHSILQHESCYNSVNEQEELLKNQITVREYRNCVQLQIEDSILADNSQQVDSFSSNYTQAFMEVKKLRGNSFFDNFVQRRSQSVKKFCCGSCSFSCDRSSVGDLLMHIATVHLGGVNLFSCNKCGHCESSPMAVITHQQYIHGYSELKMVYGYYEDAISFLNVSHTWKDESLILTVCEDLIDSESDDEKNSPPPVGHYCHYCGLYFNSYNEAVLHLVSCHSSLIPFSCEECDFATGSVEIFQRHFSFFHPTVKVKSVKKIIEDSDISQLIETSSSKKSKTLLSFVSSVTPMLSEKVSRPPKSGKNGLLKNEASSKEFVCLHCMAINSSFENIVHHVIWNHYKTSQKLSNMDQLCERLPLFGDVDGVMLKHVDIDQLICRFCEEKCPNYQSFIAHFCKCYNSRSHQRNNTWFQCLYCDYGDFASNITHSLVDHIENEHPGRVIEGLPIRSLLQMGDVYVFGVSPWPLVGTVKKGEDVLQTVKRRFYHCMYCGNEIISSLPEDDIIAHFEEYHKDKIKMNCPQCEKSYHSMREFEEHFLQHEASVSFGDSLVDYRKLENVGDQEHYEVCSKLPESNTAPFFCGHCGFHRESKLINQHFNDSHGNLVDSTHRVHLDFDKSGYKVCSSVGSSTCTPQSKGDHIITDYKCKYCESKIQSFDDMRDHLMDCHNDLWNLKCVYCMQTMSSLSEIFKHNTEAHSDCLNEVNLNSLIVLQLPKDEGENVCQNITLTAGLHNPSASGQRTAVKLWCCGYCTDEPPNRSRDGILKHISRVHRSKMRLRCRKCDFVSADEFRLAVHHSKNHSGPAEIDYYSLLDTSCFFSTWDVMVAVQIRKDDSFLKNRATVEDKSYTAKELGFYAQCGVKSEGIELHRQALSRIECLTEEQKMEYSRYTPLSIENPLFSKMWSRKAQEEGGNRYMYCCANCQYKTTLTADITRHILSVHIFIYPFRCPLCPNRGVRASNIARHLADSHPGSQATTVYWSVFTTPYYEFLLKEHPQGGEYESPCKMASSPEEVGHINCSRLVLNCIKCNGYAVNITDCQVVYRMKHHVYRHLSVKPFICMKCEACFSGRSNTIRHLQTVHKVTKSLANDYVKQTLNQNDTARAMAIVCKCAAHVNYKVVKHRSGYKCIPYESPEEEYFPPGFEREITAYRYGKHSEKVQLTNQCPICLTILHSSDDVIKHLVRTHNMSKTMQCHLCSHSTENWGEIVAHVTNHLGDEAGDIDVMNELKKMLKLSGENIKIMTFSSLMDGMGPLKVQRQGDEEYTTLTSQSTPVRTTPVKTAGEKKIKFMCTQCSYTTHKWHNLKMHLGVHFDYSLRFQCSICMSRFRDAYSTNNHASEKHPGQTYQVLRIYLPDVEKMVENELIECVRLGGNYNAINVSKMKFSCEEQKLKFEIAVDEMRNDALSGVMKIESFDNIPQPEETIVRSPVPLLHQIKLEDPKVVDPQLMDTSFLLPVRMEEFPFPTSQVAPLKRASPVTSGDRNYRAPLLIKINPQKLISSSAKRTALMEASPSDNSLLNDKSYDA